MLTKKQNLLETIRGGKPDRFVNQYEAFAIMYGEPFMIPQPDAVVFTSWFEHGNVFRSGCCFLRGLGKVFYFRPGHEEYPTFYRKDITLILKNAIAWARPLDITRPTLGHYEALEAVGDKFEGKSDAERKHENLKG